MKALVLIGAACVATSAGTAWAQRMIELPPFARTFSSSGLTRGFYFTAPADFTIVGVRVPDEAGHGLQNVEIVRFHNNQPPPQFSGTTNDFDSLFRSIGQSSASIIATRETKVREGEVIGILGACGDSTMFNSYSESAPWQTDIDGRPTTLYFMGMQFNLVSTPAQEIWGLPTDSRLGRVEVYYETSAGVCYPDCDGNEVLDFFDFLCFQNSFLAGDPYADCDGNGVLDFFDFLCFQNEFLAGCP